LYLARRYAESATAFAEAISLAPDFKPNYAQRRFAFYGLGDPNRRRLGCPGFAQHGKLADSSREANALRSRSQAIPVSERPQSAN